MKKLSLYIQHDQMDCGPTCLKMIAAYYGKYYSLETLRDICRVSREGVSLLAISEAAEKIGFRTIGAQVTMEELIKDVPLPCIAHWNQEHFLIIYDIKIKKNKKIIYIADPAGKKIPYPEKEFYHHWYSGKIEGKDVGIVLCLEPTLFFLSSLNQ